MTETRRTAMRLAIGSMLSAGTWLGSAAVVSADLQMGISLYKQGKYSEAAAQFANAPGAEAKAYLAASLAKQKKYGEAESGNTALESTQHIRRRMRVSLRVAVIRAVHRHEQQRGIFHIARHGA